MLFMSNDEFSKVKSEFLFSNSSKMDFLEIRPQPISFLFSATMVLYMGLSFTYPNRIACATFEFCSHNFEL